MLQVMPWWTANAYVSVSLAEQQEGATFIQMIPANRSFHRKSAPWSPGKKLPGQQI